MKVIILGGQQRDNEFGVQLHESQPDAAPSGIGVSPVATKNLIRPENTRIEAVLSEVDVAIHLGL